MRLVAKLQSLLVPCLMLGTVWADSSVALVDIPAFRQAAQALVDGRYDTSVDQLQKVWAELETREEADFEKNLVAAKLLESWVSGGEVKKAFQWMEGHRMFHPSAETLRWMGEVYWLTGKFEPAAHYYELYLEGAGPVDPAVRLRYAVALSRTGQFTKALDEVMALDPSKSAPESRWITARIALSAARPDIAITLLDSESTGALDRSATALEKRLLVRALVQSGRLDEAVSQLTPSLVDETDNRAAWMAVTLVDELNSEAFTARLVAHLRERDQETPAETSAVQRYVMEVWSLSEEALREKLALDVRDSEDPYLVLDAMSRLEGLAEERHEPLLEQVEADPLGSFLHQRYVLARTLNLIRQEDFSGAMEVLSRQAEGQQGQERVLTLYNMAIAALHMNDRAAFEKAVKELGLIDPQSQLLADLSYQGGMLYAEAGDLLALDLLEQFVQSHPDHLAQADARLSLAGLHLNQVPARPQAVREILTRLADMPLTLAQHERYDYTWIWLVKIDNRSDELIRLAEAFVAEWPNSRYLPDVAMLLACEYYDRNHLVQANRCFQLVAEAFPDASFARVARFFAAKTSPVGTETVVQWRDLLLAGDDLSLAAQHELGLLCLSLDQFGEAREIFRLLVSHADTDSPYRYAAKADLAFSWYAEALKKSNDTRCLEEAEQAFNRLVRLEGVPAYWKVTAQARRGKCLEMLGRSDEALSLYQDLVRDKDDTTLDPPEWGVRETEWVFRAGFAAIELLKRSQDWRGAIQLADTLAVMDGPRAITASKMAEAIRLEHWVWD